MKSNRETRVNAVTALAIACIIAGSLSVLLTPIFGFLLLVIGGIAGLSLTVDILIDYVTRKDK